jgi:hypothetical protein
MQEGTCTAHAGNYSAYQEHLATRASLQTPAGSRALPKKAQAKSARPRPATRRKLTVVERDIHQAEAELVTLQTTIEAEQQHHAAWQRLVELTTQQGAVAAHLDNLIQEWEDNMTAEEG